MDSALSKAQRTLATNVRRLRTEQHLTQERLAEAAEIDVRHIQRIEAGDGNPRLNTICLLAVALNTTPGELIAGNVNNRQHPATPSTEDR